MRRGFGFRHWHHWRHRPHRPRHCRRFGTAIRLSEMGPGEQGHVLCIGGSERFRIRLMEMGLLVGDRVEVDKYAPLQDPMEIIVQGYHLSLRVADAHKIVVEPGPE